MERCRDKVATRPEAIAGRLAPVRRRVRWTVPGLNGTLVLGRIGTGTSGQVAGITLLGGPGSNGALKLGPV